MQMDIVRFMRRIMVIYISGVKVLQELQVNRWIALETYLMLNLSLSSLILIIFL
tara:strand:- start:4036 stop:4197 length:162 start_codon:yes stop_codon:yes gene_type:complete